MTRTYQIRWSNGASEQHDTYEAACDAVRARYPEAEIGHDGDLTEHGDRTLCWRDEAESMGPHGYGDDGACAVCSIVEVS